MNIAFSSDNNVRSCESPAPCALSPALLGTVRTLFDRVFYANRYPDVEAAGIDGLEHFLSCGLMEGRTPHPLFDSAFYAAQIPAGTEAMPPFLHYLHHGTQASLDTHPLFDTSYYMQQTEGGSLHGQLPLVHFVTAGTRAQLSPNPLFDAAYYRRINQLGAAHPRHPVLHYADQGWRTGCRTHPVFDPGHYLSLRPDVAEAGVDPLAHYLRQGCREGQSPHELFDLAFYRAGFASLPSEQDIIDRIGGVIHYALHAGRRELPSPHPLFDPVHYRATQIRGAQRDGVSDPFLHFIEHGLHAGLDPHPLFNTVFYADRHPQECTEDGSPFLHFVRRGAKQGCDPGPFFDTGLYLSRYPEARHCRYGAISHYLGRDGAEPVVTSAAFDWHFYADCAKATGQTVAGDLLLHCLTTGRKLGLTPTPPAFADLGWSSLSCGRQTIDMTRDCRTSEAAKTILLISPGAGADAIASRALHAAGCLNADADLAVHVALLHGGPLETDFKAAAPTLVLTGAVAAARLLHAFARDRPDGIVIINSAAMPEIVSLAGKLGLPILAWLHEMPVSIDSLLGGNETVQSLFTHARQVITASHHARTAICDRYGTEQSRVSVLRNGLDRISAHSESTSDTRALGFAVRRELGMAPDGLLVVAGGPVDFRSGADLFIQVAHRVIEDADALGPADALAQAHFVWVGDPADRLFSALCRHDVQQLGLGERVHFLTGQDRLGRLLKAADMFLMTARTEAFDESALLATQAGLVLAGFEGCVSRADVPAGREIALVPYLDIDALAARVVTLGRRPARRRPRPAHRDLKNPQAEDAAFPTWEQWHQGMRGILRHQFSISN